MTSDGSYETIHELADLFGRYRFIELAFFGIVGRAVTRSTEPGLAVVLAETSHAHAWRAELLERCLLVSAGLPHAAESTRLPSPGHEAVLERLDALGADELGWHLVSVWYPAMADAYRGRRAHSSYAADGLVGPTLERLVFDVDRARDQLIRTLDTDRWQQERSGLRNELIEIGGPFGTRSL